jgi:hypothetical protein
MPHTVQRSLGLTDTGHQHMLWLMSLSHYAEESWTPPLTQATSICYGRCLTLHGGVLDSSIDSCHHNMTQPMPCTVQRTPGLHWLPLHGMVGILQCADSAKKFRTPLLALVTSADVSHCAEESWTPPPLTHVTNICYG